jgi:serine phosphatase RsbU (regulator of sigma subunit)
VKRWWREIRRRLRKPNAPAADVPAVAARAARDVVPVEDAAFAPVDRRRRRSALNPVAWRSLLWTAGFSLAGGGGAVLFSGAAVAAVLIVAVLLAAAFIAAVRFCLLDSWGRRFWWIWLGVGAAALVVFGAYPAGRWIAFGLGLVFLVGRRYQSFRHLTSAQRALSFLAGVVALVLLVQRPSWEIGAEAIHPLGAIVNLGRAAGDLLIPFWILSLLRLLFGMRLHFLRLRPKLAVSAMLIGLVPLLLVSALGLIVLYGALGGTRAMRARDALNEWAVLAAAGADLGGSVFEPGFRWRPGTPATAGVPPWTAEFWRRMEEAQSAANARDNASRDRVEAGGPAAARAADTTAVAAAASERDAAPSSDGATDDGRNIQFTFGSDKSGETWFWTPGDTSAYFEIDDDLWLLSISGYGGSAPELAGWKIGTITLDRLARAVSADVGLLFDRDRDDGAAATAGDTTATGAEGESEQRLRGTFRERDPDADIWHRPLYFGGALFDVIRPDGELFRRDSILLTIQVSLADLVGEFVNGQRNFNVAVVAVLGFLAALFLLIELVAAFFGFRIAGGIIGAVKELHRGTRRLAAGDLTTKIDIPNEDEFGDLAHSFNEMTAAVAEGRRVAIARERLLRELETAREIQQRLLPSASPGLPGFEIAGTSVPSRQVGGDYYDYLDLGAGRIGLAVGDVSGKGMPAALLMSNLQASLQGQVIHPATVADVVTRVNDLLVQSTDTHMFATFFYGVLDTRQSLFTSVNAGHNPPILLRADGRVERLETGGLILGILPEQEYEQETVTLQRGDVLVLFTDGITEAVARLDASGAKSASDSGGAAGSTGRGQAETATELETAVAEEIPDDPSVMFGEGALLEVVRRNSDRSAEAIRDAILASVAHHTAGAPQSDDITLVVVKRTEI